MTDSNAKINRDMKRLKTMATGVVGIAVLFNAAAFFYMQPHRIGPQADSPALAGRVVAEQVFNGGPVETHTVISADALKPGESYAARGRLTVDGSVPAGTIITVRGKLIINGDVGAGVTLRADVPVIVHTEPVTGIAMPVGKCSAFDIAAGMSLGCKTVIDGMKYKDTEADITVTGKTAPGVRFKTRGSVMVNGNVVAPAIALPAPHRAAG